MRKGWWAGAAVLVFAAMVTVLMWGVGQQRALAHCQVPCGIYDDPARIAQLLEDTTTIRKATKSMTELAGKHDPQSLNQLVRWVTTKENHAANIIEVVSEYFLAQRVMPVAPGEDGYDGYVKKLVEHHAVIIAAMKAKQNADEKYADALHEAIEAIAGYYR